MGRNWVNIASGSKKWHKGDELPQRTLPSVRKYFSFVLLVPLTNTVSVLMLLIRNKINLCTVYVYLILVPFDRFPGNRRPPDPNSFAGTTVAALPVS